MHKSAVTHILCIEAEKMRQIRRNLNEEWVKDLRTIVEQRAQLLRNEIKVRTKALAKAPEGWLRVRKYGKGYQYFHITESKDTCGTYIKSNNQKLAVALSQKAYDKKFVAEAQKELGILDEYLRRTESTAIEKIYDDMHPGKRLLINPVFEDRDTFVRNWEGVVYPPGYFAEGDAEHYTAKNERVRSKTEVNIANMLNLYGIPYRYEFPLVMDSIEFRPDFLCLNVRTRKEYVWEHFGMMELEDYARKNVDKISRYMLNGYIPGENFIMTFETTKKPLNSEVIKAMIENYLI